MAMARRTVSKNRIPDIKNRESFITVHFARAKTEAGAVFISFVFLHVPSCYGPTRWVPGILGEWFLDTHRSCDHAQVYPKSNLTYKLQLFRFCVTSIHRVY